MSRRSRHKSEPSHGSCFCGRRRWPDFRADRVRRDCRRFPAHARNSLHQHRPAARSSSSRSTTSHFVRLATGRGRGYQARLVDRLIGRERQTHLFRHQLFVPFDTRTTRPLPTPSSARQVTLLARSKVGPRKEKPSNSRRRCPNLPATRSLAAHSSTTTGRMRFGACPMPPSGGRDRAVLCRRARRTCSGPGSAVSGSIIPIDVDSIPAYSARRRAERPRRRRQLAGKDVLVGIASESSATIIFVPGYGRGYGVYVHAVGAETLKQGRPVDLGWLSALLICLAAAAPAMPASARSNATRSWGRAAALLLALPHSSNRSSSSSTSCPACSY